MLLLENIVNWKFILKTYGSESVWFLSSLITKHKDQNNKEMCTLHADKFLMACLELARYCLAQ